MNNKLDISFFPYVKDAPTTATPTASKGPETPTHTSSLRSAKPSWHKAVRSNAPVDNRQRIIVFLAGGMTYSEIRECYALSGSLNKDIYIGASTHICASSVLSEKVNNQGRRIQSPLGNLLTTSKSWSLAVLARVQCPTESL